MARDMLLHNLTWKISKKFFRRKGQDECYRFCSEAKILNGPSELFGKRQVFSTLKKCLRLNLTRKIWNHTKTDSLRMTWFRQSFPNFPYSISFPVPQSANKTLSANSNGVIQNVCVLLNRAEYMIDKSLMAPHASFQQMVNIKDHNFIADFRSVCFPFSSLSTKTNVVCLVRVDRPTVNNISSSVFGSPQRVSPNWHGMNFKINFDDTILNDIEKGIAFLSFRRSLFLSTCTNKCSTECGL